MRIDWRFSSLVFFAFALTGCGGSFLSRATPAGDWTRASAQSQHLSPLADPGIKGPMDVHDFGGTGDGSVPWAGVVADSKGNLYGTTVAGGANSSGTVWTAAPNPHGSWTYGVLYSFTGGSGDGANPYGPVSIAVSDPGCPADKHKIVGMTFQGGPQGYGTVYEDCEKGGQSTESVLYFFGGSPDGANPSGSLLIDKSGTFYGLTKFGGAPGQGTAFKLKPSGSGYIESVIYTFLGGTDGGNPVAGLIADTKGNLYGTTTLGGSSNCTGGCGTVFELTPAGSVYNETILYSFQGPLSGPDGAGPATNLIVDKKGNLYGTTVYGGSAGAGTVFELLRGKAAFSLRRSSDVSYSEKILYNFKSGTDGAMPESCVVMDNKGNLHGTTYGGGASSLGTVYVLAGSSHGWKESITHSFSGGTTDGANPTAGLLITQSGGFVVPTTGGGANGSGAADAASFNSSRSNAQCFP